MSPTSYPLHPEPPPRFPTKDCFTLNFVRLNEISLIKSPPGWRRPPTSLYITPLPLTTTVAHGDCARFRQINFFYEKQDSGSFSNLIGFVRAGKDELQYNRSGSLCVLTSVLLFFSHILKHSSQSFKATPSDRSSQPCTHVPNTCP